jgi:hypothetical protein
MPRCIVRLTSIELTHFVRRRDGAAVGALFQMRWRCAHNASCRNAGLKVSSGNRIALIVTKLALVARWRW